MDFLAPRYPLLIVLSGPSGVGKDTVLRRLQARRLPLHFVVTATNRSPRRGEVDGRDYFFISTAQFEKLIAENELLEYSVVYNDYKGVPKQQVRAALASGRDVIMRVDVQGAAKIRALVPEAVLIFLNAESPESLQRRLSARDADTPESLQIRLAAAQREVEQATLFDYLVINREQAVEATVDKIVAIIEAEHCRVKPRRVEL